MCISERVERREGECDCVFVCVCVCEREKVGNDSCDKKGERIGLTAIKL